jgi:hypothetical protein
MPDNPEWHTSRCEDCGDQIEIRNGMRTLCACDAAE